MTTTQQKGGMDYDLVERFEEFLRGYYKDDVLELASRYPREQQSLHVDWGDLYTFDPDLADDVINHPGHCLDNFDEALREYDVPADIDLASASVRVKNLRESTDITALGMEEYNDRLLNVTGQVTRVSKIRQELEEAAFECVRCGTIQHIRQDAGYQEPHECTGCERQGPFTINDDESRYNNHQLIRVQKPPEGGDGAGVQVDVNLHDDQVTSIEDRGNGGYFEAGDKLSLTLKQSIGEQVSQDSTIFETKYDAHAYTVEDTTFQDLDIDEYKEEIEAIAAGEYGDPYDLVANSINPEHYGDDYIKLAIALQMFGGWRKQSPTGSHKRGDIHILILGDPGSGKSTFLRSAEEIVPRSVFASGKGASSAGMTASAVQDDFGAGSEWTLKAGALVQADGGLACIDEIDKVKDEAVSSMHVALADQRVQVNKAGINAELNARTSLLAAGNPKYGRFNDHETIPSQIELEPTLMSRFDLMFMVTDTPDVKEDARIVEHIIDSTTAAGEYTINGEIDDELAESIQPAIDVDTLRAYIAYAQQNVRPQPAGPEVKEKIRDFFVGFRSTAAEDEDNPVPITFRTVHGIRRLAEASARIRLSDTFTVEDVERATHLVQKSMRQVGYDPESGQFDVDIVETGSSKSQDKRVNFIDSFVRENQKEYKNGVPIDDIVAEGVEEGYRESQIRHDIKERFKEMGKMYSPKDGHVRLS